MTTSNDVQEYAESLIELGKFVQANPDLFVDNSSWNGLDPITLTVHCSTQAELSDKVRLLGSGTKYSENLPSISAAWTGVKREFGVHVIDVYIESAQVCTPKKKEFRQVPKVELTDEARAQIDAIKQQYTRVESSEVVTEWQCPPSFLNLSEDTH